MAVGSVSSNLPGDDDGCKARFDKVDVDIGSERSSGIERNAFDDDDDDEHIGV